MHRLSKKNLFCLQDHSAERLKQLKFCFRLMIDEDPSEVSVIFGGDLNLRDKELNEIGGMPSDVQVPSKIPLSCYSSRITTRSNWRF